MGLTDKLKDLTDLAKDTAVEHKDQVNEAGEPRAHGETQGSPDPHVGSE